MSDIQKRWEHFPHGADIGVRGRGESLESAFEQAALAMTAVITDPRGVKPEIQCEITCECPEREILLLDWLNALVFEMATRHMLFSQFDVAIEGSQLRATIRGEKVDVERHQPAVEVKGATLTELSVHRDRTGEWIAQCVVDV